MRTSLCYDGSTIATISAHDLKLQPGDNMVNMSGVLFSKALCSEVKLASKLFSAILAGKTIRYTITGKGTQVRGRKIPWLSRFIKSISTSTLFHPSKTNVVREIKLGKLDLKLALDGGTVNADIEMDIQRSPPAYIVDTSALSISFADSISFTQAGNHSFR